MCSEYYAEAFRESFCQNGANVLRHMKNPEFDVQRPLVKSFNEILNQNIPNSLRLAEIKRDNLHFVLLNNGNLRKTKA